MSKSHTILPTVSIIIPVLNGASFLARAVNSALSQTHPALEVIVVDNNSTDETPKLLATLTKKHPAVTALHCRQAGAAAARNHGLRATRGTWIQFLDVDDELHPDKLRQQLTGIANDTAWIIGGYTNKFPDGTVLENLPHQDPWKGLVFRYRIGCTHANLYRKDALTEVGNWDEELPDNEDPELHFKLLQAGISWQINTSILCTYHHHEKGQLSGRDPRGGSRRRLQLLERVNDHLKNSLPAYWEREQAFFEGAILRALRVYATHDLGAAAGAYDRLFEQSWERQPALIAPGILRAYQHLGFRRTEQLRLLLRRWLPTSVKDRLKSPRS